MAQPSNPLKCDIPVAAADEFVAVTVEVFGLAPPEDELADAAAAAADFVGAAAAVDDDDDDAVAAAEEGGCFSGPSLPATCGVAGGVWFR